MLDSKNQEVSGSVSMAMTPDEQARAMLLIDVIEGSLISALDSGISVESGTISFQFNDDGSVSVSGSDASGSELVHDISSEEIMSFLE